MMNSNGYLPSVPIEVASVGVDLGGNLSIPIGGRVFFVRGNGTTVTQYSDDQTDPYRAAFTGQLFPSVAAALAKCVANRGDRIIVHPRHTENIANGTVWSSALVAGVKIIGLGVGTERPTFTFTAAASKVTISVASVGIYNCRFLCAGPSGTTALTVTAAWSIAADNVVLKSNYFEVGIDNDQIVAAFMSTTTAGTRFRFEENEVKTLATTSAGTSGLILNGAVDAVIARNIFFGALAANGTGWIAFATTASTNVYIIDNLITQQKAGSTCAIDLTADLVNTGWIVRNYMRLQTDGAVAPFGSIHANQNWSLMDNFVVNNNNERGLVVGTASA